MIYIIALLSILKDERIAVMMASAKILVYPFYDMAFFEQSNLYRFIMGFINSVVVILMYVVIQSASLDISQFRLIETTIAVLVTF